MAYQNVGTPRFYIDLGQYYSVTGIYTPIAGANFGEINPQILASLNPTNTQTYSGWGSTFATRNNLTPITYIAFLGHDIATERGRCYPEWAGANQDGSYNISDHYSITVDEVVNFTNNVNQEHDGFSIATFTGDEDYPYIRGVMNVDSNNDAINGNHDGGKIGAISMGTFYDMPHSPDLNLKLSYEYDGVKTIQSKGGATLSNAPYTKPADWGDRGAWQLGSDEDGRGISNFRSGRRVWDLSFSYLADSDIFPKVAATSNYESDDEVTDPSENTLLDGTDFFSVVWNRTMAGHLPFIFQPDNDSNNPDQFAICRFDMKSLQYNQVANNVYNVKLKIRECW